MGGGRDEEREPGRTGVKVSRLCGIGAAEIYPLPPQPETQGRIEAIIGT
jgi:hypothetical protein